MLNLNLLIVKISRATLVWWYKLVSSNGSLMLWRAVLLTLVISENEYARSFVERKKYGAIFKFCSKKVDYLSRILVWYQLILITLYKATLEIDPKFYF